jgi:hypothetical protein
VRISHLSAQDFVGFGKVFGVAVVLVLFGLVRQR